MFDVPPEVRATWPPPNFIDPVTRGPSLIVIVVFSIVSTILVVALRCHTRLRITGTFGPDDILIAAAIVRTITEEGIFYSLTLSGTHNRASYLRSCRQHQVWLE